MANYKNIEIRTPTNDLLVSDTAEIILSATDWTQLADNGLTDVCKAAFVTYRASIRAIRRQNPDNPIWPDAPAEEYS